MAKTVWREPLCPPTSQSKGGRTYPPEPQAIRAYIAAAPQDENTGSLLAYLSDLERGVDGKKYGLVFEEHRVPCPARSRRLGRFAPRPANAVRSRPHEA